MTLLGGLSFRSGCAALIVVLTTANQYLLGNALSEAEYGWLGVWLRTVMLATLLAGEWLARGSTNVVGRHGLHSPILYNALLYLLVLGVLLLAAAFYGGPYLHSIWPEVTPAQWLLVAALIVLNTTQVSGLGLLLGQDRIRLHALVPLVFIAAYAGGNLLVYQMGHLRLEAVMGLWAGALVLGSGLVWTALWRRGGRPLRLDRSLFGQVARIGRPGALSAVLVFLLFASSLFLVKYFTDEYRVGIFSMTITLAALVQRLPNEIGVVLLPKVLKGRDQDAVLSLQLARWTLLFSLVVAIGVLALGRPLLALAFKGKFDASYLPLVWLLPGLVCSGFGSVLNTRLAGQGYPPVTFWMPALGLLVNLGASFWLIPQQGLVGAAQATSLAYATWSMGITTYYLRQEDLGWSALFGWRNTD